MDTALLDDLLEDATPLGVNPPDADPLGWPGYDEERAEARQRTGVPEAVVAVRGRVRGADTEAVVVAWEFGFLGGSMGTAVGSTIAAAYDHARAARLPVVLLCATGGARMQEGMASLAQMPRTVLAADDHARAGLLQVAVLRHPTTGGVFASHVNVADVLWALPGATIGFAGPRVAAALSGGELPRGSHTAEGAAAAGLVDAVVPGEELTRRLAALLAWTAPDRPQPWPAVPDGARRPPADPWTEVLRARAPDRPRAPAWLAALETCAELRGDRAGADDPTVRVVLARLAGRRVVVVATDRTVAEGRVTPAGYRKVWRGVELADRLGVPVVTLVDTPGADASAASEAGGIAWHISRTFRVLLGCRTPVVSLVTGEGGSGGALALAVGDRLLIGEHATFSVIAPEGAAAILHRDPGRAAEVAARLRPDAATLAELGLADEVVPEPAGAEVAAGWAAVVRHLDALAATPPEERLRERRRRWRQAGTVTQPRGGRRA